MRTNVTTTVVITLVLSHEEAEWLHALTQNPIGDYTPTTEPPEEQEMRRKFWEATKVD